MEKLIKNVDPANWHELKREASHHRLKISEFLQYLMREHRNHERTKMTAWDQLLSGKKRLSTADAISIKKSIAEFEKEYNF